MTPIARDALTAKSASASSNLRHRLAEILRSFDFDFANDPLSVGEVYRSKGPLAEHLAVRDFVSLDFAIDQLRRLVLVRTAKFLSIQDV